MTTRVLDPHLDMSSELGSPCASMVALIQSPEYKGSGGDVGFLEYQESINRLASDMPSRNVLGGWIRKWIYAICNLIIFADLYQSLGSFLYWSNIQTVRAQP